MEFENINSAVKFIMKDYSASGRYSVRSFVSNFRGYGGKVEYAQAWNWINGNVEPKYDTLNQVIKFCGFSGLTMDGHKYIVS